MPDRPFARIRLATITAGSIVGLLAIQGAAQTWTPVDPPIVAAGPMACSADGSKLIAASPYPFSPPFWAFHIYTSTNGGGSWTLGSISFPNLDEIASSADGSRLIAAGGFIYTSTNFGLSWETITNVPFVVTLASSADGMKIIAGTYSGSYSGLFLSTNFGATWLRASNAPGGTYYCVASSADGAKLVAASDHVYTSQDSGTSWVSNNLPNESWRTVSSSADGSTLRVTSSEGSVYSSTNSGMTWISNDFPKDLWTGSTMSADGTVQAITSVSEDIYISTNSGASWNRVVPVASATFLRPSIVTSSDGTRLVAADSHGGGGGNVYLWQTTPAPRLAIQPSSDHVLISWLLPSRNFVLQQNSNLNEANWTTLTNTPTLDLTNLRNEAVLPLSSGNRFYRLANP